MTSLFAKAKEGNLAVIKATMARGYRVTPKDDACLIWNARLGRLDITKYLVRKGCNPKSSNNSALRWAARNGHMEMVKFLVSKGCDPTDMDNEALRFSARNGHLEMVKYLVSLKCDFRSKNDEALILSAKNGHFDVLQYLVKLGCNPRAQNDKALLLSYQNKYTGHHVAPYLIDLGCDESILPKFRSFGMGQRVLLWDPKWINSSGKDPLLNNGIFIKMKIKTPEEIFNLGRNELLPIASIMLKFCVEICEDSEISDVEMFTTLQKEMIDSRYTHRSQIYGQKKTYNFIKAFLKLLPTHKIHKNPYTKFEVDEDFFSKYFLNKIDQNDRLDRLDRLDQPDQCEPQSKKRPRTISFEPEIQDHEEDKEPATKKPLIRPLSEDFLISTPDEKNFIQKLNLTIDDQSDFLEKNEENL
jgi:hypothetical protein